MKLRTQLVKTVSRLALSPFGLFKGKAASELVYRKGLQMVIGCSNPYALDATGESQQAPAQFYRPAAAFAQRFEFVRKVIVETGARNLLDIGCAEGYMIGRAAKELGVIALGLELDRRRIRVGNAQSELGNDQNYGIIPAKVDIELLRSLPVFDVTICFSLLHHIIRYQGLEGARQFLRAIRQITKHRLLFDMGGPEETANNKEWGNILEYFQGDVVGKTKQFLESAGFASVTHVGSSPGYVQTVERPLFVCAGSA